MSAMAVTSSLGRGGPELVIHTIYMIVSENGLQG